MGIPGTGTATELVAWINGHPEFAALPVDLSHDRVVVIGNGNVALDVARVLTGDPDELAGTDIADHALTALRGSRVQEVVIAARRGPAHSAFTLPELVGLMTDADVVLSADDHLLVQRDLAGGADGLARQKLEVLSILGDAAEPVATAADPAGLSTDTHASPGGAPSHRSAILRHRHRRGEAGWTPDWY